MGLQLSTLMTYGVYICSQWAFIHALLSHVPFALAGLSCFSIVDQSLPNCFHWKWKKIVVDNAVLRLARACLHLIRSRDIRDQSPKLSEIYCTVDNSGTAALSLMNFCTHMYLDNLQNPIGVQGQRSRSHGFFRVFLCAWYCSYPWTVLSLEQGLTSCFTLEPLTVVFWWGVCLMWYCYRSQCGWQRCC